MQIKILDRFNVVPELFDTYVDLVPAQSVRDCDVEIWPEWAAAVPESGTTPTVFINAEPNQNMAQDLFRTRQHSRPYAVWLVSAQRSDMAWPFRHWRWMSWWSVLVHRVNQVPTVADYTAVRPWRAHALFGGYSPVRWRMLEILHTAGVLDLCLYNLWPREPGYPHHGQAWTHPQVALMDDPRFLPSYQDGFIQTMRPLQLDQSRGYVSCVIPQKIYQACEIAMVAETGDGIGINVTEKITKCLFYGQPFVVFGGAGTLNRLRQMGYKTFHPWINEDYDAIEDRQARMEAVCQAVIDYCSQDDLARATALSNMAQAAAHNARYARNWQCLLDPLRQSIAYLA